MTEKPLPRALEYKNHPITVDDDFRFTVTFPEGVTTYNRFYSLHEARDAIDKVIDAHQKAERIAKREKINMPVLTVEGVDACITGIHATQGKLLIKPTSEGRGVYPRVPWIKDLLLEEQRLKKRLIEISSVLRNLYINDSGWEGKLEKLETTFSMLQSTVAARQQKAEAVTEPMPVKYL